MLIGKNSQYYKKITSSNAKMEEYNINISDRIVIEKPIEKVFLTAIGVIGEVAASIQRDENNYKNILERNRDDLLFSAKFIEDYYNGNINIENKNLYLIVAATAYYFSGSVGSSKVLINKINCDELNLEVNGLDYAIVSLLRDNFDISDNERYKGIYFSYLINMKNNLYAYFREYNLQSNEEGKKIREQVYKYGSDLELLFIDIFLTIYNLKVKNSFIELSNEYISIESEEFRKKLLENNKIKELWPSQRSIGENGVFKGKSAVIQLPTGSGKTKSLTMLLSIYFLNQSKKISVIVAPFKALCREISDDLKKDFGKNDSIKINELNDILNDENLVLFENNVKTVIVLTPEKLTYILKKQKEIIEEIGLIIFDEGHIFDELHRGINYELLISNLKMLLKDDVQKILISAVGNSLDKVNEWLNGENGVAIRNNLIKATEKSICFISWKSFDRNLYGYLNFINPLNMQEEFYVPRFIKILPLNKKVREIKRRVFPMLNFKRFKDEYNDVAIYCGIKLCTNGSTIIFCGNKRTANKILNRILELKERGYDITTFKECCSLDEIEKISYLISKNYGDTNDYYSASKEGVFVHHADVSNGIKISLEYAMKHRLISFLICTSTLAQGVNLPIKYLIMTSIYQARNMIKARDFNNLIGRAGRPGMYTEGTIIFSDPYVYNYKERREFHYKWEKHKKLIMNNEEGNQSISMLIEMTDDDVFDLINSYYNNTFDEKLELYLSNFEKFQKEKEKERINGILKILSQVENFIMSYLTEKSFEEAKESIKKIAMETLGYYVANDEKKVKIIELFTLIAKFCFENVQTAEKRYLYSENVFGVKDNNIIENYITENLEKILNSQDTEQLLENLYELITSIEKIDDENVKEIVNLWIKGYSYKEIQDECRNISDINECLKICNKKISYEMPLIVCAVQDNIKYKTESNHSVLYILNLLIKQLKYGIESEIGIQIYELGFSDREVAKEIENYLERSVSRKIEAFEVKDMILEEKNNILNILNNYPSVFKYQLDLL